MLECASCAEPLNATAAAWRDAPTGFPTRLGQPYHPRCAPPQRYADAHAHRVELGVYRRLGVNPAGISDADLDRICTGIKRYRKSSLRIGDDMRAGQIRFIIDEVRDRMGNRHISAKVAGHLLHFYIEPAA